MTLYKHELKQGRKTFLLWSLSIAAFMAMCVFLFPEMKEQMGSVGDLFASMGSFTTAFGMDKLDFGTFLGFYAVECGNILSVGGAFYAAIAAVNVLSREEKEHTAEFLFVHPLSRSRILAAKLAAVLSELVLMNLLVLALTAGSIACIGEELPWEDLLRLHGAFFFCQTELALICFAISACSRGNNFGLGLGMTMVLYFMSLLANVSDKLKVFHYISPFGYAEGSDIITNGKLEAGLIIGGLLCGAALAAAGWLYYREKDLS